MSDENRGRTGLTDVDGASAVLVTRSTVPAGKKYGEYKNYLRHDFYYSCAYCSMTEAEAQAIRFTIDHYEPRNARPELQDDYKNLMYACDECNLRKGDRYPPPDARKYGHRFFRPDEDIHEQHFEKQGIRIGPRTNIGAFTINAMDLNRLTLRRLRNIRSRLSKCDRYVIDGIAALRKAPLDLLPPQARSRAAWAINEAIEVAESMADEIDAKLREHARSPLLDEDPDAYARAQERMSELKKLEALYPGRWRAPRKKKAQK